MTIETTATYSRASGNGVTTVFAFTFEVFDSTDLVVRDIVDATGVATTKTLTTDYTVTLSATGEGGTVTFLVAPASGHTVDLRSAIPLLQPTSIRNQGPFHPELHEDVFDRLERQIQDTRRIADSAIRFPDYEVARSMELPKLVDIAGKYVALDASGNPIGSAGTGNDSALRTDLAVTTSGSDGSRLVGFRRVATGSVARSVYLEIVDREVNFKDFGPVGDGVTDDRAALVNAIAACSAGDCLLIPRPTTKYLISNEVVVNKSNITIRAESTGGSGNGSFPKPFLLLGSGATAGAALLRWSAYAENVKILGLGIDIKTLAKTLKCLRFAELRSSVIRDCWLEGNGTVADDTTGILFDGSGTYTGDVNVVDNYITNHLVNVDIALSCTTVRVLHNEIYGTAAHATNVGIRNASACVGNLFSGNTIQNFSKGIQNRGVSARIIDNYFETNTTSYDNSAASLPICVGNAIISGGNPTFPATNQASVDIRSRNFRVDDAYAEFGLGYKERYRTVLLGDLTTYAPAYTGSGTLTFTGVTSTVIRYSLVGNRMKVQWFLSGTIGGAGAELRIALPAGATAVGRFRNPVFNFENAAQKFGVAEVQNGDAFIRVFKDSAVSGSWTAGGGETYGEIEFLVSGV